MNVFDYAEDELRQFVTETMTRLAQTSDGSEAVSIMVAALRRYTIFDLQTIGANIRFEVKKLPEPYRSRYHPFAQDLLTQYEEFISRRILRPVIANTELWKSYWESGIAAIFSVEKIKDDPRPALTSVAGKLFYRLVYGYAMLIAGKPGHPIGMPFPGGWSVTKENGVVYCPLRDKEKDLPHALCNYCPAEQNPQYCALPQTYTE
ncbi:MAG TPA: DUF2115 domain-containing protein [Methanocorpusculum sp.]|nr:DUF2115 domain-containing protein [Methanocorpusculum sp.]